jgi:hypothetical protein
MLLSPQTTDCEGRGYAHKFEVGAARRGFVFAPIWAERDLWHRPLGIISCQSGLLCLRSWFPLPAC